ncbi:hypothetical protein FACS1894172_03420 [Spirochaetia bacterium]|nr:hypothetical protein FACS1894172_03420 [Spirochaetia bacterium]
MKIIVDTTIWSKAYRREKINEKDQNIVDKLIALIELDRVIMIGAVR